MSQTYITRQEEATFDPASLPVQSVCTRAYSQFPDIILSPITPLLAMRIPNSICTNLSVNHNSTSSSPIHQLFGVQSLVKINTDPHRSLFAGNIRLKLRKTSCIGISLVPIASFSLVFLSSNRTALSANILSPTLPIVS